MEAAAKKFSHTIFIDYGSMFDKSYSWSGKQFSKSSEYRRFLSLSVHNKI